MRRPIFAISLFFSVSIMMMLMVFIYASMANNTLAYATSAINPTTTTTTNTSFLDNVETKKVRVGDIDIAYKIFGKGEPLLLIPGFSMTMNMWGPIGLEKLSSNHTIIISDIRGIGNTTVGSNKTSASIQLFANDTAGLIYALGIRKPVDILGLSMGGFVAQELTLSHPEKVNRLIIFSSTCGGKETLPPQLSPEVSKNMVSGNASIDTFLSTLFPKEWIKQHTDYIQKNLVPTLPIGKVSKESLQLQLEATSKWSGTCNKLSSITKPTLVITGTDDITSPPANSLMIAEKIPGAWLVQIKGGGHGLIVQYPQQSTAVLETFLSIT